MGGLFSAQSGHRNFFWQEKNKNPDMNRKAGYFMIGNI